MEGDGKFVTVLALFRGMSYGSHDTPEYTLWVAFRNYFTILGFYQGLA
jgi:hypothetical protein